MRKGIALDFNKGVGNDYLNDIRVIEGISADSVDITTKIKRCEVDDSIRTEIFNNSDIAVSLCCVLPISLRNNVCYTGIITCEAMVPVFVKICRKIVRCKVKVTIIGAIECIRTNMLCCCRYRQLAKRRTFVKRKSTNAFNSFRKIKCRQGRAIAECKVIDIRKLCVAEINVLKTSHSLKAVRLN